MERVEIALVKDEKKPSITRHDDCISVICEISEQNIHELAILKEYLEKVGIMVNAVRYLGTDILSFSIHKETYEKVVNRNAGRKKEPKDKEKEAFILEFKVHDPEDESDLKETVQAALKQIEEKQYETSLIAKRICKDKIHKYGFAFEGKKILIG